MARKVKKDWAYNLALRLSRGLERGAVWDDLPPVAAALRRAWKRGYAAGAKAERPVRWVVYYRHSEPRANWARSKTLPRVYATKEAAEKDIHRWIRTGTTVLRRAQPAKANEK